MNKTLAGGAWLVLSTLSPTALAIGLGQASALSPLEAPLEARVTLIKADGVRLEDISASVADPDAFSALGLAWSPLLSGVEVTPVRQSGRTYLRLNSQRVVDTPWLDVPITLTTPAGRQTQWVTLLFDPVDYLPGAPDASLAASPAPNARAFEPAPVNPSFAMVGQGDTLWDIALRTRPPGVDVQQMVMALADANPAAFADGGIDTLTVGQRLHLPSREEALRLSPQQAARGVSTQSAATPTPSSSAEAATASSPELGESAAPSETLESAVIKALALSDDPIAEAPPRPLAMIAPVSVEAALAVSGAALPDGRVWANSPLALDVLGQVLVSLSPFATVEAAPTESEYQALLEQQARQVAEIETLKREVAELRQALGDVQALLARPAQTLPESGPPAPTSGGFLAVLREHWVWPVGLGLALLLAAKVISRKRRERQWEPAPTVDKKAVGDSPAPFTAVAFDERTPVQSPDFEADPTRPLSPSIDYAPERMSFDAAKTPAASTPLAAEERPGLEPEWEIEEVAFKPYRRDNS